MIYRLERPLIENTGILQTQVHITCLANKQGILLQGDSNITIETTHRTKQNLFTLHNYSVHLAILLPVLRMLFSN